MLSMTSLVAQNQFGMLIDTSLRQPVAVTRRGRPVAVVLSYDDYMQRNRSISIEAAQFISENYPLRGKAAAQAMQKHLASMSNKAHEEGLTEDSVLQMLNED
jgi:prevent-host-death family protein